MNDQIDVDNPPSEIEIPTDLTADVSQQQSQTDSDSGAQTMIPFPFCLLYNQKPWQTITVAAPSPELAATTIDQFVQLINQKLVQLKYPPLCSARTGQC